MTKCLFFALDLDLMWQQYFFAGWDLDWMGAKLSHFEGWIGFL